LIYTSQFLNVTKADPFIEILVVQLDSMVELIVFKIKMCAGSISVMISWFPITLTLHFAAFIVSMLSRYSVFKLSWADIKFSQIK